MNAKKLEKYFPKTKKSSHEPISNITTDISHLVIPFSKICKSYKNMDIYSGSEKMSFKERDQEYKMILRHEFAENFNAEFRVFKSIIAFPSL